MKVEEPMTAAERAEKELLERGLQVVKRWADRGRPFTANDFRDELTMVGFPKTGRGGLMTAALARKIVRRTDTRVVTHARSVVQYIGTHVGSGNTEIAPRGDVVVIPVQRDRAGKFSAKGQPAESPADRGMLSLFEDDE